MASAESTCALRILPREAGSDSAICIAPGLTHVLLVGPSRCWSSVRLGESHACGWQPSRDLRRSARIQSRLACCGVQGGDLSHSDSQGKLPSVSLPPPPPVQHMASYASSNAFHLFSIVSCRQRSTSYQFLLKNDVFFSFPTSTYFDNLFLLSL